MREICGDIQQETRKVTGRAGKRTRLYSGVSQTGYIWRMFSMQEEK